MIRRTAPLFGPAFLLLALLAACSSSSDGATTTTVDPKRSLQADNLSGYARDVEGHQTASIAAVPDSGAARYAQWVADYDDQHSVTIRKVGEVWQACGAGQAPGTCATLTDFTFDAANRVQGFTFEGRPIDDLVKGPGAKAELSNGAIAGVAFREAFLNPKDRRLYVAMNVLWNPEILPDTTGCDPAKATYSQGGAASDPLGGGQGPDMLTTWLMTVSFPDASLGGELKVPCFRRDGASEVFTIQVPA
ncbi:hypothetical protein BH10ACT1_BH10ACT1_09260 [soil metagenome]